MRKSRNLCLAELIPIYRTAFVIALADYGRRTGLGRPRQEWHHRFGPPDDIRIYVPDLVFIFAPPDAHLPEYATSASDIHFEILSPSQALSGMIDRIRFYLQNGVKRVWLVEPEKKRILPGFQLSLSELFSSI